MELLAEKVTMLIIIIPLQEGELSILQGEFGKLQITINSHSTFCKVYSNYIFYIVLCFIFPPFLVQDINLSRSNNFNVYDFHE